MMLAGKVLRILTVSESEVDTFEILRPLECLGYPIESERVTTVEEFVSKLELFSWTVILFMSNTSTFFSRDALIQSKRISPELPFIIISKGIGEEEVANMMKAGAEDVVLLSRSSRLLQVVKRVLREGEIKEKEAAANKVAHFAYAAREQMLAIVSHDIKNPLSAIQLQAQMLLRVADGHDKTLLSDEVKIQASRILKTTERLKELIADLLDKSKTENGLSSLQKSACDVSKIFQEVLDTNRLLLVQKSIVVRTTFPDDIYLELDKNKIFQVLSNLVCNAIKFTPLGGDIHLSIVESEHDFVFSVTDNGPGLRPNEINLVFQKYWTGGITGQSGTGLGLFICKTIVDAHGGHIGVENLSDCGSRFWFSIPKTCNVAKPFHRIKDNIRKILVIDDDDDLREVISWALSKEGFAVHSYADPKEALKNLKNGCHFPQLILVDYQMDGMKGCEFLTHKNEIELVEVKECPVLMISASPEEVLSSASTELYKEILTKPLDLQALMKNIKKYVN
jgi:signal transduction histidine kinase/CheY-like chemotaxis protein